MGHGRNGLRGAEFAAETAELGAEVTVAAEKRGGGDPERGRRAIDHVSGASANHFAARDPIIGTQPQPRGKVVLVLPAGHLQADLAN